MTEQCILLPVDGSEHSLRATDEAIQLSRMTGSEILLLHCHLALPLVHEGRDYASVREKLMAIADNLLEPYRARFSEQGVQFRERILEGQAAELISQTAREQNCSYIVMGSRGRSDFQGLFLGSVTHRVLQTAPCPVLVTR